MTLGSRFLPRRKLALTGQPLDLADSSAFEKRIVPVALPLLLAIGLGVAAAAIIAQGSFAMLVPLALLIPAAILLIRDPLLGVMVWIVLFPFYLRENSAVGSLMFWVLHRGMIPVALILVILADWFKLRKHDPIHLGFPDYVMLIFLVWSVVNIMLLNGSSRTLIRFYDRTGVPFLMYWLIRLIAPTPADLRRFLPAAVFMALFQCIVGLLAWFAPQTLPPDWQGLSGERTVGTLGNVAVYTSTLVFLAVLILQYAMTTRSRLIRWTLLLIFGLSYFCVFFSFSRGSWLGGIIVLLGLLFIYPRMMTRMTILLVAAIVVLGNTVLANEIAFAVERLNDTQTAEGRIVGDAASLKMIVEKPVFGWGYGNYDNYDEQFKDRVGDVALQKGGTSHNTPLTIMAELGVPGYLLYILPALYWLWRTWKVRERFPSTGLFGRQLLIMLWLVLLFHFVVTNFMDMIRFHPFGITIWWMALAWIANLVYPYLTPGYQPDRAA